MSKTLVDPHQNEISISLLNLVHHIAPQSLPLCKRSELPEHLSELFDKISDDASGTEENQIKNLLLDFEDIFLESYGELGHTALLEDSIDTGSANPIKVPPWRLSQSQKEIVVKELQKMLDQNVIEPSNSSWSAPVVLVRNMMVLQDFA